jgi:diguanylate cyclase (GGDEF)-like protein
MAAMAMPPVWELVVTLPREEKLHARGLSWTTLYGQVQRRTEESRRSFLYALILAAPHDRDPHKSSPDEMARWIPTLRQADLDVSLSVGKAIFLSPNPHGNATLRQFESEWEDYTAVRDDVLALALQGRIAEATNLEAESGTLAFAQAETTLARVEPLLDGWLNERCDAMHWARVRAIIGLAALLLAVICLAGVFLWADRTRRTLLLSLEENNSALHAEKEMETQHNRVLELIGTKESLETVLDAVAVALHRQQPDPENGCAVLAFQGMQLSVQVRGLPDDLIAALKQFAIRVAGGEPVDECKETLRQAARQDGFEDCRFAPVWPNGTEDGGWILVFQKQPAEPLKAASMLILRAQRAAALAIENRRLYEQLTQQAHYDALTQLPNRLLFHDRLHQALSHGRRHRTKVAILWLDLDGFKRVNDTLGHRAGDALLRLVAERLQSCMRETDTLARPGGDEFTVVLKDLREMSAAIGVAEKLLDALRQPFHVARRDLSIGASIGVSIFPDHGEDVTAVVKSADIALYRAKSLGRNRVEVFSPDMADVERQRLELEIELRAAIANEEFELYYQPQVDLSGRLAGMEALMRWNKRAAGALPPSEFIPAAEANGLIVPLGAWALRRACLQCREWMDRGLAVPPFAVNVSTVQLAQTDFAACVKQCLEEARIEPERLELEITESSFLSDAVESNQQIEHIRALGVRISIDDFGTGYSSLSYLHRLPVDALKIDQSFVRDINNTSGGTASVVRAIVAMAHSLDLSVIAEGVETREQVEAIREAGCDFAQGYYFHRPLTVEATARLLADAGRTPEKRDLEAILKGVMESAGA